MTMLLISCGIDVNVDTSLENQCQHYQSTLQELVPRNICEASWVDDGSAVYWPEAAYLMLRPNNLAWVGPVLFNHETNQPGVLAKDLDGTCTYVLCDGGPK